MKISRSDPAGTSAAPSSSSLNEAESCRTLSRSQLIVLQPLSVPPCTYQRPGTAWHQVWHLRSGFSGGFLIKAAICDAVPILHTIVPSLTIPLPINAMAESPPPITTFVLGESPVSLAALCEIWPATSNGAAVSGHISVLRPSFFIRGMHHLLFLTEYANVDDASV